MNMNMTTDNIYLKCRICVNDIEDTSLAITIFSRDFLDEKIRKYLHVNIDFSDKYQKRLCRNCLIKLEDIHQFACVAQRNQQIFIKYTTALKKSKSTKLKPPIITEEEVSIFACSELKLGQMIKDEGLQKLILKALKWDDSSKSIKQQLEILKNTNYREIINNPLLLHDEDLMQLLGPHVNQDSFDTTKNSNSSDNGINDDNTITEMEVGVDPDLFFPFDDDETRSAEESIHPIEDVKPLICSSCPQLFTTQSALQDHVIVSHLIEKQKNITENKPKQIVSKKQPKQLKVQRKKIEQSENRTPNMTVKRTRKKTTSSKYSCNICGKKLSTKGNLKVHFETHKPKGEFSCEKCGRIFKTYINLVRHRKYHTGEKFSCPHCPRVYPTNSTLRAHVVVHSNHRPHECHICLKTFKRNQDLKFHINQHTGDKPYKCPYCPKAFASSGNCFSHRKRMHSDLN